MKTFPVLQSQMGILMSMVSNPQSTQYNLPSITVLNENVDINILAESLLKLYCHIPVFKTRFKLDSNGNAQQWCDENMELKVPIRSISELEFHKYIKQSFVKPFNLFDGTPLSRAEIIITEKSRYLLQDYCHIIMDGMSYTPNLTIHKLNNAYKGIYEKEEYGLYEAADEEIKTLCSESYNKAKELYKNKLEGLTFATLAKASTNPLGKMIRKSSFLERKECDNFCKNNDIPVNLLFQAAFSKALASLVFSTDSRVLYTTVNHGRLNRKLRTALGMFVKTVPILLDLKPEMTIIELIKQIKLEMISSVRNCVYPFTHLCSDLGMKQGISFNFQAYEAMEEQFIINDERLDAIQPLRMEIENDICVFIFLSGNNYEIRVESSSALNDSSIVETFAIVIRNILEQIISNPNIQLKDIKNINEEEEANILTIGEGEKRKYDCKKTFIDLFEEQVKNTPNNIAVVDNESNMSYQQLDNLSNIIALSLEKQGIQKGDFVCVMLPRIKEFVASVIGIMKTGAAYVPIDISYPEERKHFIIKDSEAKITINEDWIVKSIQIYNNDNSQSTYKSKATYKELAYMIYTSGSTGTPKGAMLHHEGLTHFIHVVRNMEKLSYKDRILSHRSFSFDAHIEDIYAILTLGGSVHIIPEDIRLNLSDIKDFIINHKITGGGFSTAIGQLIIHEYKDLPVRFITLGGEKLEKVQNCSYEIINVYGPTECTDDTHYYTIKPGTSMVNVPIGHTIENHESIVVDRFGQALPMHIPGELLFCGIQVGRGYWKKPDLTKQKFLFINPLGECIPVYHTGDLVRWNKNNELEFISRIDGQRKLRGFRIELGEIEYNATNFKGIKRAIATIYKDNIVLYYTLAKEVEFNQKELEKHLSNTLPEFMVPSNYIELDNFPLTHNGKIELKALPEPILINEEHYEKPEGMYEIAISEGFSKVLGTVSPISATSSFLSLGGDSIKAIRLVSLLRESGIDLHVSDIMKYKTVQDIAKNVNLNHKKKNSKDENHSIFTGEITNTPIIDYFWKLNLPSPEHFLQSLTLKCKVPIDSEYLRRTINVLLEYHDMLRATVQGNKLRIESPKSIAWDLFEFNISKVSEIEYLGDSAKSSFDIKKSLLRILLFHCNGQDYIVFAIHHLVVDGVSWRIILEDFQNIYTSIAKNTKFVLPDKTSTYIDFSNSINKYKHSTIAKEEKKYWQKKHNLMISLPTCNGKDYNRYFKQLSFEIPELTTYTLLHNCFNVCSLEINDLLVTAFVRTIKNVFNESIVSINLEGHGRENLYEPVQFDRTIGWFTAIYPVIFEKTNGDILKDLINVKETLRRIPNKGIGYGAIMGIDVDIVPRFLFNYMGEMDIEMGKNSIVEITNINSGYDNSLNNTKGESITINCYTLSGKMNFVISYDCQLYNEQTIICFREYFTKEIELIIKFCNNNPNKYCTASDLGELEWTNKEFDDVVKSFGNKKEIVSRIYPLSPMQESMLYKHLNEPESLAYRIINILEYNFIPTESQIKNVLERLLYKHEVLRTSIIYKDVSIPRQAIIGNRSPRYSFIDISETDDKKSELEKIRLEILHNWYDLQENNLFGFVCVKIDDNHSALYVIYHHIILDGWSTSIIINDIDKFLIEEFTSTQKDIKNTTKGLFEEVLKEIQRKNKDEALRYWIDLLDDYNTNTIIPRTLELDSCSCKEIDTIELALSSEESNSLLNICKKLDVTPNILFELGVGILLTKYTNSYDVVFDIVTSGRDKTNKNVDNLVGMLINTIPVRLKLNKETTIQAALKQLQEQATNSNLYDFCSLSDIQKATNLREFKNRVLLAYENYPIKTEQENFKLSGKLISAKDEQFNEICFIVNVEEDKFNIKCLFDYKKYAYGQIELIITHLQNIIHTEIFDYKRKISDVCMLSSSEINKINVLAWKNGKSVKEPQTLVEVFKNQVEQTPNNIAVVYNDKKITYKELDIITDKIALHIVDNYNLKKNDVIGIYIKRSELMVIYPLAALKSGTTYMPIDYELPQERLAYIINDANVRLVLTEEYLTDCLSLFYEGDIFTMKRIHDQKDDYVKTSIAPSPQDTCVILYTSGSTGLPKGVKLEHHSIVNHNNYYNKIAGLCPNDRIGAFASFGFDMHLLDIFSPLAVGASLYIYDENIRHDINALSNYISDNGITVMFLPTQLGVFFINHCSAPTLRLLSVAGEKLPKIKKPLYRLINGYGPTETTLYATMYEIQEDYEKPYIGVPSAGYGVYVVDKDYQLMPIGIEGELVIAGEGVGGGYLNQPQLNKQRFINLSDLSNSFAKEMHTKAYLTGDIVRWSSSGNLEFIGRNDRQIKINGHRIELSEIEECARNCKGINNAVAKYINNNKFSCKIILYYITSSEDIPTQEILAEILKKKLPPYMVPNLYVNLDVIPLTSNGKIDYNKLPVPEETYIQNTNELTKTERILVEIIEEIASISLSDVESDFPLIGIDSLLIMRICFIVRQKFGIDISVQDVIKANNVRNLCKLIDKVFSSKESDLHLNASINKDVAKLKLRKFTQKK